VRRLSGGLQQPLGGAEYLAAAFATGGISALMRWAEWRLPLVPRAQFMRGAAQGVAGNWYAGLAFAVPGLAALVLLTAITLPGTPAAAVIVAWFILVAAEAAAWCQTGWASHLLERVSLERGSRPVLVQSAGAAPRALLLANEPIEPELPPGLVQQITRIREDGVESLHAVFLAEVPAGERLTVGHLAFCPPLDSLPELEAHALDADGAEVRIALAETFGARFEIRLAQVAAMPRQVLIEAIGTAAAPAAFRRADAG
jgi:hypothetical protein